MKKDLSILMGNALDHFDVSLYSFLAPLMGPIFFPDYDPIVQLILTYCTSITSFFSRPIGTFIFGTLACYKGPLFGLSYSLMGVAVTTVCIGCIPSYKTIGVLAPIILFIMKIIHGICAAGESIIAQLYIMENKSEKDALKISYVYQSSSMLGIIMASTLSAFVIRLQMPHAWRLCFVMGGFTGFIGYYLRYYSFGDQCFQQSNAFTFYTISSIRLLWNNKILILHIAIVTCFSYVTYAVPFVFMNNFIPYVTTISLSTMMLLNTSLLLFDMISIPVIGRFTLHYDAHKIMISAAIILAITIIPLFVYLLNASLLYVTFVRIWIVFWGLVFLCPLHFWFNSLCKTSNKYLLIGMGNAFGVALLGHMTVPICLWLWYKSGIVYAPALYMVVIMGVTIYVIQFSTKNVKKDP